MKKLFGGAFDYIKARKICWYISLGILVVGLILNIVLGTQLDISFKGGTMVKYSYTGTLDPAAAATAIETATGHKVDAQLSETADIQIVNIYTTDELTLEDEEAMTAALSAAYPDSAVTSLDANSLSASMGQLFLIKCLVAVVLAGILLVIYVAFRFRKIGGWTAGVMALVALAHDLMVAYFSFVIFRIPLDGNFVAAMLTILGYSLNSTLVVYDRIRENRSLLARTASLSEIVNTSLNQSFARNFNTGLTTFLAIGSVAAVALVLGLSAITSFAVPMLFGVISGFYTSTFLAAPTWVLWEEKRAQKAAAKAKKKK